MKRLFTSLMLTGICHARLSQTTGDTLVLRDIEPDQTLPANQIELTIGGDMYIHCK